MGLFNIKKIAFLSALFFAFFSAQGLDKINLALDWYINPDHAPILVAQKLGYFKQQGLDVNLLTPVQSTEPAELVAAGQADMAIDYQPSLLIEMDSNMPLIWVGTLVDQPLNCVVVLADSNIKNFADLKGQTIGYSASPSTQAMLNTMLAYKSLSPNSVTQVDIQMDLIQALLSHKVTAVDGMMRNVEPVQMQEMGYGTRMFFPETYGVPSYDELVFIANSKTVNRSKINRFNRAIAEAVAYLKAHPQASWQEVSAMYQQQLAPNAQMAKANAAIWMASIQYFADNPSHLDPGRYQAFVGFMLKNKLIKHSINIQQYTGS